LKPILKWAGGKGSLLDELKKYSPKHYNEYHEVFVGGGALFFNLTPRKGTINDINKKLINFYKKVKKRPEELIEKALEYTKYATDKEKYYKLRIRFNDESIDNLEQAALFLYFNKTAYNGLYRVNSNGHFNVPIGKYKNPTIVNKNRIRDASKILRNIKILNKDFSYITKYAKKGDFCYFDPPYYQNKKNKFSDYSKFGFSLDDHIRLCEVCFDIHKKGVRFVLSNSNAPEIIEMYDEKGFKREFVDSKWMISCNAATRKKVQEIVVSNIGMD